jgi:hypothetical protein
MKTAMRMSRGIVGLLAAAVLVAAPGFAAAATANVVTKQVIPVGGNSCAPLFVNEVKTYVYDGELQAFEIVLSDPSYVGLFGMAGDVAIPFNYMSRHLEPNGTLRYLLVTTAQINDTIPVTVTLLSAGTGATTCLSTVSFTTDSTGSVTTGNPTAVPVVTDNTPSGPVSGGTQGTGSGTNNGVSGAKAGPVVGSTTGTSTSIGEVLVKMCSKNGAYQLWFILLAIFFVICAFVGLSQPPLTQRNGGLPLVLISIPTVILLLFWYFVPDCRLSWLIPAITLVAAAIGLFSAYRSSPIMRPIMELPPAQPKKPENKDSKGK